MNKVNILKAFLAYKGSWGRSGVCTPDMLIHLSLIEVLVLTDIILTFEMFRKNLAWDAFSFDEAFNEIYNISENTYTLINKHETFFTNFCKSIDDDVLNNKGFKTNFKLNYGGLDKYIYANCIIRSVCFVNNVSDNASIDEVDNMLHRNVVISNISDYSQVFYLLGGDVKFKELCVKIMMILGDQILSKKIRFVVKKTDKDKIKGDKQLPNNNEHNIGGLIHDNHEGLVDNDKPNRGNDSSTGKKKLLNKGYEFKTDMYIKFNIIEPLPFSMRFVPLYAQKPFIELKG
jgi:hypothetical protein